MSKDVHTHHVSDKKDVAVTISDAAIAHFEKQLQQRDRAQGIRLSVKNAGCSGLRYALEYVDTINQEDQIFSITPSLTLFVATDSLLFLKGTQIDVRQEGLNTKIIYHNPNEIGACGCGESFSVDE